MGVNLGCDVIRFSPEMKAWALMCLSKHPTKRLTQLGDNSAHGSSFNLQKYLISNKKMWFLSVELPALSAGGGGGTDRLFVKQRMLQSPLVSDTPCPELAKFILNLEIQYIT